MHKNRQTLDRDFQDLLQFAIMITILNRQNKSDSNQALIESIFTEEAKEFLRKLITRFDKDVADLLCNRRKTKIEYNVSGKLPSFKQSAAAEDKSWGISPVPPRLRQRHLDVGDVSPADGHKLRTALQADVDGIQVDFDDGHCPSWSNQLRGWENIKNFVAGGMKGLTHLQSSECDGWN